MERTDRSDQRARADFAHWLRRQLEARGFDLSIRGGGQTRFAESSGIGRSTISRILAGQGATDTRVLAQLATALDIPLSEVLVRAGILNPRDLEAINDQTGTRRITPEEAATELGIEDEQERRLFIAMTETLQRNRPTEEAQRASEH
jgi:transcriptional regulator with XRE-family HTH domain